MLLNDVSEFIFKATPFRGLTLPKLNPVVIRVRLESLRRSSGSAECQSTGEVCNLHHLLEKVLSLAEAIECAALEGMNEG